MNRHRVPGVHAAGAYGVANSVPGLPFARERGTTAVSSLLFDLDFNQNGRVASARRYATALHAPAGSFVGITGAIPARAEQAELIEEGLRLIELVTVALIAVIVALYMRSLLAPLVTLDGRGRIRGVGALRRRGRQEHRFVGSSGGGADHGRAAVRGGHRLWAVLHVALPAAAPGRPGGAGRRRETAAELTPLILVCGVSVAVGSAALVVADLGFLRAFGPGMAAAVLVGLVVTITFIPAVLATVGRRCYGRARGTRRRERPRRPGGWTG